ncbi:alkyl/aryl-sulfatase [Streptomyces boncukensis]|uniref:MBL fold metallo-hydrolase n=1 Tax=Streptomyces boncukensis TaxID=2711219 RepID=A0A6G4X5M8_9ACTN|nr:alkyl sulfatase dimerization domain-containing protein [Streptomyces boncukensis]NGO72825.1 MBL fold metallo-hydrolase [Streptomyces boncukensis]
MTRNPTGPEQGPDGADFADADRGFLGALSPAVIRAADGRVVWDGEAYGFLAGPCPGTVHPSLWRQGQLCARQGLYEVTEGVYQVRGLDLSNMTLVEGERGVLVIDPLLSAECAAAALALYREHRGDRPVTGLLYTHSHVDHFGGARGVLPESEEEGVPVLAPAHFLEHAVSENVYAGTAMSRRSTFMYGDQLPTGPEGAVGTGLGLTTSTGTITLVPPTVDITRTGQREAVDGIRMVFQLTPGAEAPAEMNLLLPDRRALCVAENATHTLHNVITLRGAVVRDARAWARYLDEAVEMFDGAYDVAFASHHWPTWGRENVREFLSQQRDLYAYLHDQTLRLLNQGLTGPEIAEELRLPPALERAWHGRGYYGSLSHNVKGVYQRYLGWFDGNAAHLWEHPPAQLARRYVEVAGGPEQALAKARAYVAAGDLRFAATLLNHLVFADPEDAGARGVLAEVYDRLGQGAENGPWRNFYLTAAHELRHGVSPVGHRIAEDLGSPVVQALTTTMLLDTLAIRIDGPRAWDEDLTIDLALTDEQCRHRLTLRNGALTHRAVPLGHHARSAAGLTLFLTRPRLLGVLARKGLDGSPADDGGGADYTDDGVEYEGDPALLGRLFACVTDPDPSFPVITP